MGVKHFNKIINIYFLDKNGNQTKDRIICPTTGRKPEIEFNGKFEAGFQIPAFTITISNLYINLSGFQYPKVMVEAGYKGNLVKFSGSIISIFQESPGPDGKTVISCYLGSYKDWLNSMVDISLEAGATLKNAIDKVTEALGFSAAQIPAVLQSLPLPAAFAESGMAKNVLKSLFSLFPEYGLEMAEINEKLYVYSLKKAPTSVKTIQVDYLSSPPQKNPGDEDGAYYTVFTAPWNPNVQPGVVAVYPAWEYIKFFNLVNAESQSNAIKVQFVQVHFSTVGSINQMQVAGLGVQV